MTLPLDCDKIMNILSKERRSMKRNFKIIESLLALTCACLLLASTIFAWISLRPEAEIQEFVVNAGEYKLGIVLELRKRNEWETGEFQTYQTKAEIAALFQNAVPNDNFDFRLKITNLSSFQIETDVILLNVTSENASDGSDMRNVFYIDEGKVNLNGSPRTLNVKSSEPEYAHEQELNLYRLNNLLNEEGGINLLQDVFLDLEATITVEFTLTYDKNTSHSSYQEGVLNIDAIFIRYE